MSDYDHTMYRGYRYYDVDLFQRYDRKIDRIDPLNIDPSRPATGRDHLIDLRCDSASTHCKVLNKYRQCHANVYLALIIHTTLQPAIYFIRGAS